jgi:hypothetical protein
VLLSNRDYVKLAAPEPEALRLIGDESKRNGTHKMTSRQIDQEIKAYRAEKKKRCRLRWLARPILLWLN